MPIPQGLTNALNAIDTETNNVAAVVDNLRNQIKENMSAEEVTAVTTQLDNVSTRLRGIAADPNNPVPNPEPTPEPTPE